MKRICRNIERALENFGLTVKYYTETGSTNTEAKEYASAASDMSPALFLAEKQTSGRGRLGREFVSHKNRGIYMSLLFFAESRLESVLSVTTFAACAVALAIEKQICKELKIKWVNDIYNERGKVCGILTEAVTIGDKVAIIVGIGINYGKEDFPDNIKGIASSVGDLSARQIEEIITDVCRDLLSYEKNASAEYLCEYRKRFMLMDNEVQIISAGEVVKRGTVRGIDDGGGLILEVNGKREIINTGEVSVRKK